MNKFDLEEAINSFDIKAFNKEYKDLFAERHRFVNEFTLVKVETMTIDEYVIGKQISEDNFCYAVERKLDKLGRILGATSAKFGIYFSPGQNQYVINNKFQRGTLEASFEYLKNCLVELILAGKNNDLQVIRDSPISPMFKGKILYLYYPNRYLNIFSEDHLNYFIHRLGIDAYITKNMDVLDKREALVKFKNEQPIMKGWSNDEFSYFLYNYYPKAPKATDNQFEFFDEVEELNLDYEKDDDSGHTTKAGKPDYDAEQRKRKKLGERGEVVAIRYELQRLKSLGLKKKPKHISLTDDSCGYDILSYNADNSERYIEVKTTSSSLKHFNFFFTANELSAAQELKSNYHVYVVFHANSAHPQVMDLGNPFTSGKEIKLIPISYKVNLKAVPND